MFNLLLWILIFIPAFILGEVCRLLSPIVCLFVYTEPRYDRVKRLGKVYALLPRTNLIPLLSGFNTHDNNTDEWWYGCYNEINLFKFIREWTQADYERSVLIRYYCRVMWLWRNSAYGFNYAWFSREKSPLKYVREYGSEASGFWLLLQVYESSFQLEAHIPLGFRYFNSINIGWKEHTGQDKLLYAGRILGLRHTN